MPTQEGSLLDRIRSAGRALMGREERSLPHPDLMWAGHHGVPAPFKPRESLNAFDDNVYLHRAVQTIAMEIGRTKFRLQRTNAKGEIEVIQKHQALTTLEKPQQTKGGKSLLTGMVLKIVSAMHLMLNGEAFWLLDRRIKVSGAPTWIEPLLPGYVFQRFHENGELKDYVYRLPQREVVLDPLDVVHFKLPDPSNWLRGNSPVQSIRYALDAHREADVLNAKLLENGAVPGGVLETEKKINDDDRRKLLAQFRSAYGGSGNAGKVAMLPDGLKFNRTQQTNQEMQWKEGKDTVRDEILANYGVGLEILGKTESQTRANAETAVFVFQKFGVLPYLELFRDTLDNDYLPAFSGSDDMEWGYPDPVPENMEEKRLNARLLFDLGGLTPNEARKMFGMEPLTIDGMDAPYTPISAIEMGTEPVEPEVEPEEEEDDADDA